MTCIACQKEIVPESRFCYFCGAKQSEPAASAQAGSRTLRRSVADRKIAGVCAGLANYLDLDVSLVRILWVILSIFAAGVIAYLICWIVIPEEAPGTPPLSRKRLERSVRDAKLGGVCAGFADYFGLDVTLIRIAWVIVALTGTGIVAYIVCWIVMPEAAVNFQASASAAH